MPTVNLHLPGNVLAAPMLIQTETHVNYVEDKDIYVGTNPDQKKIWEM